MTNQDASYRIFRELDNLYTCRRSIKGLALLSYVHDEKQEHLLSSDDAAGIYDILELLTDQLEQIDNNIRAALKNTQLDNSLDRNSDLTKGFADTFNIDETRIKKLPLSPATLKPKSSTKQQ